MMDIATISLFPEMFAALDHGVIGRAVKNQHVAMKHWQLRDFTQDKHRTVDDRPYGGGPGMLLKSEPLHAAIVAAKQKQGEGSKVIYVSPQGEPFSQPLAEKAQRFEKMIFIAGRYEGVDERLIESEVDMEWSLGDYVISGGELAVMVMLDSIIRLMPGVLGHNESASNDSFSHGLLDHPHYTRPEHYAEKQVPEVLLSGNHAAVERWRLKQALGRTWLRRPEVLDKLTLSEKQQTLLEEYKRDARQ